MSTPGFTADAVLGAHIPARGRLRAQGTSNDQIVPSLRWGNFRPEHCTRTGFRQHSAILWDIPWGASWERACATTPGLEGRVPNRCVNTGTNMWGQWDVRDASCGLLPQPTTTCRQDPAACTCDTRCQICTRDNGDGTASTWHTC